MFSRNCILMFLWAKCCTTWVSNMDRSILAILIWHAWISNCKWEKMAGQWRSAKQTKTGYSNNCTIFWYINYFLHAIGNTDIQFVTDFFSSLHFWKNRRRRWDKVLLEIGHVYVDLMYVHVYLAYDILRLMHFFINIHPIFYKYDTAILLYTDFFPTQGPVSWKVSHWAWLKAESGSQIWDFCILAEFLAQMDFTKGGSAETSLKLWSQLFNLISYI